MPDRIDPPFGWSDGPTNRMDALFDVGLTTRQVSERLGIALKLTRRRRTDRRAIESALTRPAIPPDRQLEIAMAALYPEEQLIKENNE